MSPDDKHEINFSEFVQYVVDHEQRLELIFKDLDRNQDGICFVCCINSVTFFRLGFIDIREIKNYCHDLNIPISDDKAAMIIEK